MPHPRIDVVVLTMNDRPVQEAAAQATLLAQSDVDIRVVVVGNGCRPEVVPSGALTVCLPENVGIPGGRNAGADALRQAGDPADWLFFLDNDASFPCPDVLARLVAEAEQHPEAAWVQPRLTGPDDSTTPRRWVPRLRASDPGRPGRVTSMTEGIVMVRRDAFDAVGGWESSLFLYHEGADLAWRLYAAGWSGWYAAGIRMHHPLSTPARHALYHRLAARNRIWIAYRNLPAALIPLYLSVWTTITLLRAVRGGGLGETLRGMREGWTTRRTQPRRPMSWRTVYRLTAAGRPPIV
ncbi:glycosyltransferase family 2 protein [Streptomyces filamentosus]|uniref:Glycosyl transferase n=1 Tax=Streptomyces filamentosus TaxID=67294 RepID=A0A919BTD6_STRFL|nr:glycosyltransferase family 2 protein [Streptomyces filamentosus]GHG13080.1 glycosyl transferase [Streptomyces filamentosus]